MVSFTTVSNFLTQMTGIRYQLQNQARVIERASYLSSAANGTEQKEQLVPFYFEIQGER